MTKTVHPALSVFAAMAIIGLLPACAHQGTVDPRLFSGPVDLERYAGAWYQVLEARTNDATLFGRVEGVQSDVCFGVRVQYELRGRTVRLQNTCNRGGFDGPLVQISGTATPQDDWNTRLKVRFDPLYLLPFQFDYWILDVDPSYQLAVLASPNATGVTILSRTRVPDKDLMARALALAAARGFDPAASIATPQPANDLDEPK